MNPVSTRLSRAMLWLAPRRLRRKHGAEMLVVFSDALAAARQKGAAATAATWTRATGDLLAACLREPFRRRRRVSIPTERKPIMFGTDLKYTVRWLLRQKFSTSLVAATCSRRSASGTKSPALDHSSSPFCFCVIIRRHQACVVFTATATECPG